MLLSLHLILHLLSLHFVKVKKVKIFIIKEKFPLKWFWMLVMPFSGLRQAHPANLPQQVFRRLPAKRHGVLLVVLAILINLLVLLVKQQMPGGLGEGVRGLGSGR